MFPIIRVVSFVSTLPTISWKLEQLFISHLPKTKEAGCVFKWFKLLGRLQLTLVWKQIQASKIIWRSKSNILIPKLLVCKKSKIGLEIFWKKIGKTQQEVVKEWRFAVLRKVFQHLRDVIIGWLIFLLGLRCTFKVLENRIALRKTCHNPS